MKGLIIILGFLFPSILYSQTQSLWSKDSIKYSSLQQIHSSQYTSPLFAEPTEFFIGDSIKKSNQYAAVHTWLVKDFNQDGYSDIFLGFFTGGEAEKIPFKLFFYDTTSGKYIDKSNVINNNTGQTFNRKSMAADLNGDGIPDMVAVSHAECDTCKLSYFDILLSDKKNGTWNQNTLKTPDRYKGEGYFHGVALGDIDNDGDVDIVLANENTFFGGNITMTNDGKGNFTEKYSMNFFHDFALNYGTSWTLELVDINKDSYLDLLYWNDSTNRGVAYGDGSGYFGNKLEQKFPKIKYSYIMDYDAFDIDNDDDLDLILSTNEYNKGWELVFLENKGNDSDGKVIWKDRSTEINNKLINNGFYSDNVSKNWLPYLALADLNKDGFIDLFPQRPLSNLQGEWIVYGKGGWDFSYTPNMIPEKQPKIITQISNSGKLRLSWKKSIITLPTSNTAINSWKLYMHNKPFGDKGMIKLPPLLVNNSNSTITTDSVIFLTYLQFDTTYFRVSVIDSNSLETPLSDASIYSCFTPVAPFVRDTAYCLNVNVDSLKSTPLTGHNLIWYGSNATGGVGTNTAVKPNTSNIGSLNYYVSQVNTATGCESPRAKIAVVINSLPIAPSVKDTSYCNNVNPDTLRVNSISGTKLLWYGTNATGGVGSATAIKPNTSTVGTLNYYVSQVATTTGCEGPRSKIVVTIIPSPSTPTITWNGTQFTATTSSTGINYQWLLSNSSVSGATSATYKPTAIGSYKIQITDANGCKNVSDSFSLVVTAVNPSFETSAGHIAKIAPNPASTDVSIYFQQKPNKTLTIRVLNLNGQVLKQITTNSQSTRISLSEIIAGNYIIEIIGKGYNQTQQLLITK
jgi:hypothetical protein